ncbi:hypothetical protein J6590_032209 [Homalodisca vitripennis]|nr:hypothetical protein J6590_032209 [Homalodisca vitripennis]
MVTIPTVITSRNREGKEPTSRSAFLPTQQIYLLTGNSDFYCSLVSRGCYSASKWVAPPPLVLAFNGAFNKGMHSFLDLEGWKAVEKRLRINVILTVVAIYIHELILHADAAEVPRNRDIHQHHTRQSGLYSLPNHHLQLYERKPSYNGRKLYNLLPPELQLK